MVHNKVCWCGRTSLMEVCILLSTLVVDVIIFKTYIHFNLRWLIVKKQEGMNEKDYCNQRVDLQYTIQYGLTL